ncbi:MAG: electron transfer flavoprotein subunit alpha/FixB family protein [Gemmatimonadetes bacterium]|nr:electron transfer flavoprotein subunit alpha/FixB family protein [Gemmatimonadota bacterium]MCY3611537.1 electron transfer flavoprotein subunit alpha/FixB family protein [Gemmatimonadota bacterium]
MADVLAVAESKQEALAGVSREVVAVARRMADELGCLVEVAATAASADELARYGADRIVHMAGDDLLPGQVDAWAAALAGRIRAGDYAAVVIAATAAGKDLAPRVAAKLGTSLLTDVTDVAVDAGGILVTRPVFAGKALAQVRAVASPALLSIRPNVFPAAESPRDAIMEMAAADTSDRSPGYRVVGFEASRGASIDVSEATIVVSGGRGLKGPENWHVVEDLRDALGESAALGASRAVVDAGWRPHSEQVGQTGKTVTPKLYLAVAISGAIQHLAGMRTSGVIVAVNRDADAPIFGVADYGIVGDAFDVVPALAAAIRELRDG